MGDMPNADCHAIADCPSFEEMNQQRLANRSLSIQLIDELTNEGVRVEIVKEGEGAGTVGLVGHPRLLNWFCQQVPLFHGLMSGEIDTNRKIFKKVSATDFPWPEFSAEQK